MVGLKAKIVKKKADHILKKLRDEEVYYTFDLLEEYIFYAVADDCHEMALLSYDYLKSFSNGENYAEVVDTLKD